MTANIRTADNLLVATVGTATGRKMVDKLAAEKAGEFVPAKDPSKRAFRVNRDFVWEQQGQDPAMTLYIWAGYLIVCD